MVLALILILGFILGKRYFNNNLFNLVFGFMMLDSLLKFLPISYDILSVNYHDATFLFMMLLLLLGVIVVRIFSSFDVKSDAVGCCAFFLLMGFIVGGKKIGLSFACYGVFTLIMGIYLSNKKGNVFNVLSFLIGCLLCKISSWLIGLFLGFLLGMVVYYIVCNLSCVIRNKEKRVSVFLVVGMILSFLGAMFK